MKETDRQFVRISTKTHKLQQRKITLYKHSINVWAYCLGRFSLIWFTRRTSQQCSGGRWLFHSTGAVEFAIGNYRVSIARYQLRTTKVATQCAPFKWLHLKLSAPGCFVTQNSEPLPTNTTQNASTAITCILIDDTLKNSPIYLLNLLAYLLIYLLTVIGHTTVLPSTAVFLTWRKIVSTVRHYNAWTLMLNSCRHNKVRLINNVCSLFVQ